MCNYKIHEEQEKVWPAHRSAKLESGTWPQPYSSKPGLSGISANKPRRLGYYINIIAKMSKEIKVTQAQMRLIALELQKKDIDGILIMDKCGQERLFIETVRRYVNVPEEAVREFLI